MGLPLIDRLAGSSDGGDPSTTVAARAQGRVAHRARRDRPGAPGEGPRRAHSLGLLAACAARRHRRLDSRARQQRRFSGRQRGRDKTVAMSDRLDKSAAGHDLIETIRRAARQEQFLEVVSAEEARARFARHVDLAPLPAGARCACRLARPRARARRQGADRRAAVRSLQCRRLCVARRRHGGRERRLAEAASPQCRGRRLRSRADIRRRRPAPRPPSPPAAWCRAAPTPS